MPFHWYQILLEFHLPQESPGKPRSYHQNESSKLVFCLPQFATTPMFLLLLLNLHSIQIYLTLS